MFLMGEGVAELVPFGREIAPVIGIGRDFERHALGDVDAEFFEGQGFVGIVRQQPQTVDTERAQDLPGNAVVAGIGDKTQRGIGLDGVVPQVLQGIGADLTSLLRKRRASSTRQDPWMARFP